MFLTSFISTFELAIIIPAVILITLFPIWALVDLIRSDNSVDSKILWVIIIFFFNILGSILYFLFGRPKRGYNNYHGSYYRKRDERYRTN
ncbi:PLDc_N domain-containing protein [Prolixibacteraceae bacterium JC049]|nr:PLDc_N domain-containing protein [Prolixibacteraceae bacterium JC049]